MRHKFACFIFSHGRAKTMTTHALLRKSGYTGMIYIICDDEDDQIEDYKKLENEKQKVIIFNKSKYVDSGEIDSLDNFHKHYCLLWGRNAGFDIAEELGLEYFVQLDDDYREFLFRYPEEGKLKANKVLDLDYIFDLYLDFMDTDKRIKSVAFMQGGDFIGGVNSWLKNPCKRKVMNSWFCKTERRIHFKGTMNDDVNTYCDGGARGDLYFSFNNPIIVPEQTQKIDGGMSVIYADMGTYIKSFYTVMLCPSFVTVSTMGGSHQRIHHRINSKNGFPMIISDKWKKARHG